MKNFILTLVTGLILLPAASQAQLLEIKQTVFGMDCAPCAYGLENRIQKLDGVQSASVSLNEGMLTATLHKDNNLKLKTIRKAVEESGFKAKEAEVSAAGTLDRNEQGRYVLETGSGQRILLETENESLLRKFSGTRQTVVVSGRVESSDDAQTTIRVQQVDKAESQAY